MNWFDRLDKWMARQKTPHPIIHRTRVVVSVDSATIIDLTLDGVVSVDDRILTTDSPGTHNLLKIYNHPPEIRDHTR